MLPPGRRSVVVKVRSVLVFPPVNNYRRFLIHKVSEEYPEELCTFSIGQGHGRRTVVCFKRLLIRDLHQTRPTDEPVSDTSQKRLGTMGVECQRVADEAAAAPAKDNNVKRARAVPTVGIYRPPAARRSEEQTAPLPRSGPSTVEIKCDRTRPGRQRRPDIQVYVPRARRLLTGGQDRIATSTTSTPSCQESSGQNLRTQENLLSKNLTRPSQKSNTLLPNKDHKSKSAAFQCDSLPLNSVSLGPDPNETDMEVSKWTESMGQAGESNCDLSNFSSEVNDVEQFNMGVNGVMTQQILAEKAHSASRKKDVRKMENFEVGMEEVGVGRGIMSAKCKSSTFGRRKRSEGQVWDCFNNIKNGSSISETASLQCGKDKCDSVQSSNARRESVARSVNEKEECDTTQSVCEDSRPVDFTDNFPCEVGVGRGFTRRGGDTPGHGSLNSPLETDNGVRVWDYYSENENAANSSQDKISSCETDIPESSERSGTCNDHDFVNKCLDMSLNQEESNSMAKSSDDSDQFQDFSDAVHENEFINSRDEEVRNIYGDTSSPSSVGREKRDGSSEDGVRSKNTFVSDECHKKNENDCRVQEEQNRKNRRIIRRNFMSDVLIISPPVTDVTPLSKHVDSSADNTLLPSGVFNKKKKVQCKGENVIMKNDGPHSEEQSADKQKSSPVSDLVSLNLNPDECTWDMMFDDDGECLDPKLMEELTKSVGSVTIEKPQSDYRSYQSHVELVGGTATDDEFSHVLEIYNFPAEFKTNDLCAVFSPYMKRGFEIKWVDDTHALGVFSSSVVAAEVLAAHHPFVKTRPLHEATHESRMKARRSAEFLQPCRVRPETCAALARRLVTGALGVRLNTTREEREAERKILSEAREKKKLAARQRDEAWEGTLGEK